MTDKPNDDEDNTPASQATPGDARPGADETAERKANFSRRALIEAGWTVPVVLSVVLPEHVLAQSSPGNLFHLDHHADLIIIEHNDALFTDGTAHNDMAHADTPHGDTHVDSGNLLPIHADIFVAPQHIDISFADGGFADHADTLSMHHADLAHVDNHIDFGFNVLPPHVDFHADFPHLDFAINVHSDHTDGQPNPPGGGAFTDHTDGSCRTTHGDNSHSDTNTHNDHWDITPNAQLHVDHCDTQGGHADSGVGHQDVHADRHADIRHSDVHLDFNRP